MPPDVTIRPFETVEELRECVRLQEETWGVGFSECVPPAILKVSQILGGVAAGAYTADGVLVGFVFGMTGVRGGELVHWSDMLAVREPLRNSGLGTRLKAYQREEVRALGVSKMHWTFDPLQSRNAWVNFAKLGIVAREYVEDMYGETDSPLHRGIGTDRLIALWLLDSERVRSRLEGRGRDSGARAPEGGATDPAPPPAAGAVRALAGTDGPGGLPRPGRPDLSLDAERVLVSIPSEIGAVMEASMDLALEWRRATRSALAHYLGRGWEVRELLRGRITSDYLLTPIQEATP